MFSNTSIAFESQIPFPKENLLTMKESPNLPLVFVSMPFFSFSSALLHGSIFLLDSLKSFTMKLKKTMKETPNLLLAFVSKFFFSFSSALLHGSMPDDERVTLFCDDTQHGSPKGVVLDSLKAFTMKLKKTMKENPNLLLGFVSMPFFSFSSVLLHGPIPLLDSLKAFTTKIMKTMKKSPESFLAFVSNFFFSLSSALLHGLILLLDFLKAFTMKKSLGLFVALAFTPFFSFSSALLHGSFLLLLFSLFVFSLNFLPDLSIPGRSCFALSLW